MIRRIGFELALGAFAALAVSNFAAGQDERPGATPNREQGQGGGGRGQRGEAGQAGGRPAFGLEAMGTPEDRLRALRQQISTRPRNFGGGRGGRGGGGGGFMGGGANGGIYALVLRNRPLQEEIGMTEAQRTQLEEVSNNARDKMRDVMRNAFQQGGGQQGGRGGQQGQGGRGGQQGRGFDPAQFEAMQGEMAKMQAENEAAIKRVLDKKQITRLNEIRLQILDAFAVAEEDVAKAISLNDEQWEQIQAIMADYDQATMAQMQEQFRGMGNMFGRGGRGGNQDAAGQPGAGPGQGGGAPGAPGAGANRAAGGRVGPGAGQNGGRPGNANRDDSDDDDDDDNDAAAGNTSRQARANQRGGENAAGGNPQGGGPQQGGRRNFELTEEQRAEMEARMTALREKTAALDKQATTAIGKVLLPANKSKFNKMLGAKFDLTKLTQQPERGPQDGRRGGEAAQNRRPAAPPTGADAKGEAEDSTDSSKSTTTPANRPRPRVRGN